MLGRGGGLGQVGALAAAAGVSRAPSYLAKLLNAADCGLMHRGTRDVFNCSAMNLCISSATYKYKDYCDKYRTIIVTYLAMTLAQNNPNSNELYCENIYTEFRNAV